MGALLDLMIVNKERLVEDVKVEGSLICSVHGMAEFKILRKEAGQKPRLQQSRLWPLQGSVGTLPWDKALHEKGAQESCLIFEGHLLQAEEQSIAMRRNSDRNAKRIL